MSICYNRSTVWTSKGYRTLTVLLKMDRSSKLKRHAWWRLKSLCGSWRSYVQK